MNWERLDVSALPSPCYVVDKAALRRNAEVLATVQEKAGCQILLALKGFALWAAFPLLRPYLAGCAASSLHEARLAFEEFQKQVHVYAPAYRDDEFSELLQYVDHVVFNSFSQWEHLGRQAVEAGKSCGLRVNPEHSEVSVRLYDPCASRSRLGIIPSQFKWECIEGLEGLHFHTLCELNADALFYTLPFVEQRFGRLFPSLRWVNFGGGHHITRADYDVDLLIRIIRDFREKYGLSVYLEPGEAIALGTGILVATVLDIVVNDGPVAILDTSATAHMPDVLEMPYRPEIVGASLPYKHPYTYRLGGLTCLAGDVIGDYSFPEPLKVGQKLIFLDMAHYTMVKNTTFNGVNLPSIVLYDSGTGEVEVVRQFGYADYRGRLS